MERAHHRDRDGALRPKSFERWRRLTLLAQGAIPDLVSLEDANDLIDILQATGRTIARGRWCAEAVQARNEEFAANFF